MTIIMPDSDMFNNQGFFILILIIVILQLRQRKVKLWTLFIMPIFISIVTIPLVSSEITSLFNLFIILMALVVGLIMGFLIGKFYEVKIDENGTMILKALEHEMFGASKNILFFERFLYCSIFMDCNYITKNIW